MSTKKNQPQAPPEDREPEHTVGTDSVSARAESSAVTDSSAQQSGVLVGIPAYNEEGTVESVVTDAIEYADDVVVVDDGSADETAQRAQKAGATVITHPQNQGYGATVQTLFTQASDADADCLVTIDADAQHDVSDVETLVKACQESEASVVIASRFLGGSQPNVPTYRRLGLTVINFLSNLAIRIRGGKTMVSDTQSGFRAYDAKAIETVARAEDIGLGMDASLDILFHVVSHGHNVAEVPTTINYDVKESSTHNPIVHGLSLIRSIAAEFIRMRD